MKTSREPTYYFLRSLSVQFLIAGGLVMMVAAYVVGTWVATRIEQGVVQTSGASAALYIESLIPTQSRGPAEEATISEGARLALHEVFQEGILSDRVVTYNIWNQNGEILDSYRPDQRGRFYEPTKALLTAWSGEVASQFQTLQVQADHPEATLGVPLLEVYVPIRDARTGEVLVVVEFYQRAEELASALMKARRDSWTLVAQIFGISGALLFVIVHTGSRLIERQGEQLLMQLSESRRLSASNDALRKNVIQAAQRSTAQAEKLMHRIGQDLHDGVAQHLSLASLRLEGAGLGPSKDAETVRQSLENAMKELRGISRGLSLPDLATLDLSGSAEQAVDDHNKSFGSDAKLLDDTITKIDISYAKKLCVYRFIQESLANVSRHAHATEITIRLTIDSAWINVKVSDNGCGFDTQTPAKVREDGGQGLLGLSDRAATLGGKIGITSQSGKGTEIRLHLPLSEEQE
ncbi:MAG: sensor histidine kinase [Yoonia sp.]|nr:sensor histidine kinase [Loktanella sp.]